MSNIYERSMGLLGEEAFNKIQSKTLAVIGLGGVGGTALEALARAGFKSFIIVDFDKADESNLNRQILYTSKDVGQPKVDCACNRLKAINNEIEVTKLNYKVDEEIGERLAQYSIDFIVDAIDDVNGKISLIKYANEKNIPIIVSLGMANRFNPADVYVTRLDKTTGDPLAKKIRYEVKKAGLETNQIICVCSKETPIKDGVKLNSMMQVPSSAGLNIAYYVIKYFQ